VPYVYKEKNLVNAIQWAVGLELLLLITDPWRVCLTTDHPNGACFWRYPEILRLLMDREFRKEEIKKLPEKVLPRIVLPELDREYTLYEIAIITSAGPARTLGLEQKGHLGVGADADVAIYESRANPEEMFAHPRMVLKAGQVIVEEGEIRNVIDGAQFAAKPNYDPSIEDYLRPLFQQQYTVSFDNYPVSEECVHGLSVHACGSCLPK
jgi:formylmethanofuran dehydrogenase subunit A